MAANTNPIWSRTADVQWGEVATANTAKDGTGTVVTVFTADATEGGYVNKAIVKAKGTNTATVMRFWLNNGGSNAVAANNTLIGDLTIAATTNSEVAKLADNEFILDQMIPPGYKINVTIGTTVAAGLHVCVFGGKY